jgi:DHA2 family multidrug resistance protein
VITFCAYGVLYGGTTTLPGMLQSLFGYDAYHSGLVLSPAGIFSVLLLPVVGFLLGRQTDARWLIGLGLIIMAAGNYWLSQLNLEVGPWQVVWPRVLVIVGLSILFAPINVAAYMYTPMALRGAAVGLFALLRNEGGSVGTSMAKTIHDRRLQFHDLRLGESLDDFNPTVNSYMARAQEFFFGHTGDPALSQQMAWQGLDNLREQQASSLAYFDCFWGFAFLAIVLLFLVPLMKRSVAEKGAHVAAE